MKEFSEIIEDIKCIISLEVGKRAVLDNDVALALGLHHGNLTTRKRRNSIPFKELCDFAQGRWLSINDILYRKEV